MERPLPVRRAMFFLSPCHELKQRTVDVGKLTTLCEALLRTQKFDVLLFSTQVVEVQVSRPHGHSEYDHRL